MIQRLHNLLNHPILLILFAISTLTAGTAEKIRTIGNADGKSEPYFYTPKKVISGPDGNLYVLDVGNIHIKVVTQEGKYLKTIGSAGQGPGEFVEPTDIFIENVSLWVLDHALRRINLFSLEDDQFLFSINVQIMPFAFTRTNESFICSHLVIGDNFLIRYDDYSAITGYSESLVPDEMVLVNPFQYMAYLTSSNDGTLYLSYLYENKIEKRGLDLKVIKSMELSDELTVPTVEKDTNANIVYVSGPEISNGICYDGGKVFVLWQKEDPSSLECAPSRINVYDNDLNPIETIYLEDCLTGFSVKDTILYGTVEEPYPAIVIYQLRDVK
jgi:hypothetical protein